MPINGDGFNSSVSMPPELKVIHIRKAIDFVEKEAEDFADVYREQANVFSALIGIFGVRALNAFSPYKKHKHPDVAQQQFPDLSLNGKLKPPPKYALESKGTTRPWALQSHYNHSGWYIVWRYLIDDTKTIKAQKEVVIWRVDICFLKEEDWKYEGSKAKEGRGGRTHTFGIKKPSTKFRNAIVYRLPGIAIKGGKPVLTNGK